MSKCPWLLALCGLVGFGAANRAGAQGYPHPFIYFTTAQRQAVRTKVTTHGTASSAAYDLLATAGSYDGQTADCSVDQRTCMRQMEELAFRYAVDPEANVAYGQSAKTVLLAMVGDPHMPPPKTQLGKRTWWYGTQLVATAATFDMIYPLLSASQRRQVVEHLETWCARYMSAVAPGGPAFVHWDSLSNYPISAHAATLLAALAIEGDSKHADLQRWITDNRRRLRAGASDAVDPDGSCQEGFGYAAYGYQLFVNVGVALLNRGYEDLFDGTNVLKIPDWYTYGWTAANKYPEINDSHKTDGRTLVGNHLYSIGRTGNGLALWGWHKVRSANPSASIHSFFFSPQLPIALWYPENLTPASPDAQGWPTSKYFRDNLNQGRKNRVKAYPAVGDGGEIYMHNKFDGPGRVSVLYKVRDEWAFHVHEDDGHISLHAFGEVFLQDYGYYNGRTSGDDAYFGCQSIDHNLVTVAGDHFTYGLRGQDHTKHYDEPPPEGRYYGKVLAFLSGGFADYAHGRHKNVWVTDTGERILIFVKGPDPYLIVRDKVQRRDAPAYEWNLHTPVRPTGAATMQSPLVITRPGDKTLSVVLIEPDGFSAPLIAAHSHHTPPHNWRTVITKNAAAGQATSFLAFMQPRKPDVPAPASVTKTSSDKHVGMAIDFGSYTDRLLFGNETTSISDGTVTVQAEAAVVRLAAGVVQGFVMGEGVRLECSGLTLADTDGVVASIATDATSVHISADDLTNCAVYAPAAAEVMLNGRPAAWRRCGGYVVIGSAPIDRKGRFGRPGGD